VSPRIPAPLGQLADLPVDVVAAIEPLGRVADRLPGGSRRG
jgi:hypothetical protein